MMSVTIQRNGDRKSTVTIRDDDETERSLAVCSEDEIVAGGDVLPSSGMINTTGKRGKPNELMNNASRSSSSSRKMASLCQQSLHDSFASSIQNAIATATMRRRRFIKCQLAA